MAIVKMKAVTIAAQISEFDTVVEKYVYGRDIHLENAMSVISNRGKLKNFEENNEYDIVAKNALSIMNLANYTVNKKLIAPESVKLGDMQNFIDGINEHIEEERDQSDELSERIKANEAAVEQLNLMLSMDVDLSKIFKFEFIRCRFGHIPKTGYKTLITYLDNLETFFIKTAEDATDVWGFYFAPLLKERKIEEVFNSLYFEPMDISEDYVGTPLEIKRGLLNQNQKLKQQIEELTDRLKRNMAEFDNFRKRTEKEKSSMYIIGAKDIVEKMLPVVDNFERGLAQAPEGDSFADGMKMIYKQLITTLDELGVKPIEAVGKEFDPNFHNAVMHVEDEEAGENIVVEEFQKGYTYKDFVVRHSMVKVAN